MNGIVIIGGSAEAHALACQLPQASVHLPVRDRVARDWPRPPTVGPVDAERLRHLEARVVVEAAHPCDIEKAFAVSCACETMGVPCLQLVRPGWSAGPRDRWVRLRRPEDAARIIPKSARVLATTGRAVLPRLKALDAYVLARRLGRSDRFPLRLGRFLPGQGPFTVAQEITLLRRERIDWLIVHDAGGPGGWPKLEAARRLGLPVALIDRPTRPDGPRVETVQEALAWLKTR